jgi:hypothetical protein
MNTVVILIHGYNVTDMSSSVGKFRPVFEEMGCMVEYFPYGYWPWPWQITKRNPKFAKEVTERARRWKDKGYRVVIACHSNGATITWLACHTRAAPIDRILAVHPALHKNKPISTKAEKVIVVHNQGDKAVVAGGVLGWISRHLVPKSWTFRPWGQMGQDGYTGTAENHINIDSGNAEQWAMPCSGHGQEFHEGYDAYWLPLLANEILA